MIKNDVGMYANNVYSLLSQKGRLSVRRINEITHKGESVIILSLGWLLSENKIDMVEQNGEWCFEVKNSYSEIYY